MRYASACLADLVLASCLFHVVYATQAQSTVYRKARGHDRGDRGAPRQQGAARRTRATRYMCRGAAP